MISHEPHVYSKSIPISADGWIFPLLFGPFLGCLGGERQERDFFLCIEVRNLSLIFFLFCQLFGSGLQPERHMYIPMFVAFALYDGLRRKITSLNSNSSSHGV